MLNKLIIHIRHNDPGYFRLLHSFKTILAILICLIFLNKADMFTRVFAGMATGFLMQCINGNNRGEELESLAIATGAFYFAYLLGALAKPSQIFSGLVLASLAFLAMYVRKYGSYYIIMPIFAWCFCYSALIIPWTHEDIILTNNIAMGISFLATAFVYFLIFPVDRKKQFNKNLQRFFKFYSEALHWLHKAIRKKSYETGFVAKMEEYKQVLIDLLLLNQTIVTSITDTSSKEYKYFFGRYLLQSDVCKAAAIIFEAFTKLCQDDLFLDHESKTQLLKVIHQGIKTLDMITLDNTKLVKKEIFVSEKTITKFQTFLTAGSYHSTEYFIALLNINLGLRIFFKTLPKFFR